MASECVKARAKARAKARGALLNSAAFPPHARLVCLSPSICSAPETISSLEFAARAMDVEVHVALAETEGAKRAEGAEEADMKEDIIPALGVT